MIHFTLKSNKDREKSCEGVFFDLFFHVRFEVESMRTGAEKTAVQMLETSDVSSLSKAGKPLIFRHFRGLKLT
jgi:hypothetical protein